MKNRFSVILIVFALLLLVAGCGLGGLAGGGDDKSDSGSTSEKKAESSDDKSSTTSGGDILNSGVKECDELAKFVNDNSEEIEGSFAGKALLLIYRNTILKAIEEGFEKMDDKQKENWAEVCSKSHKQLIEQKEKEGK